METAASFFSIKVAGGPKPAPSKLPDPPGFNSTPKKHKEEEGGWQYQ